MDAKLQMKIKKYLVDVWEAKKRNMITTQGLIEMIPSDYKLELILQIYGRAMLKNKVVLRLFGHHTLKKLCQLCTEKMFLPNEIIYADNSLDNKGCFYIERGRVELYLKRDSQMFLLNVLAVHKIFRKKSSKFAKGRKLVRGVLILYKHAKDRVCQIHKIHIHNNNRPG